MTTPKAPKQHITSVTQQDIALRCGVSRVTVSLALRGDSRISQETKQRIRIIAAEMGYDPSYHHVARRLALHRYGQRAINRAVGLAFPTTAPRSNYFMELLRGILEVLLPEQFELVMSSPTPENPVVPASFVRGDVDGVLAYKVERTFSAIVSQLRGNPAFGKRPVLSMVLSMPDCSAVLTDDQAGAHDGAAHLLALGHRHILRLAPQQSQSSDRERLAGVRKAFRECNLDTDTYLHQLALSPDWLEPAEINAGDRNAWRDDQGQFHEKPDILLPFLSVHPEITAILAMNDACALRVWRLLEQQGLRVPEDISLIGFDDTDPRLDVRGQNILTSIRVPLREVGRESARLMIQRITGQAPEDERVILPTELIVRGSTAPPRAPQ